MLIEQVSSVDSVHELASSGSRGCDDNIFRRQARNCKRCCAHCRIPPKKNSCYLCDIASAVRLFKSITSVYYGGGSVVVFEIQSDLRAAQAVDNSVDCICIAVVERMVDDFQFVGLCDGGAVVD